MTERFVWLLCFVVGAFTGAFVMGPYEDDQDPAIPLYPPALADMTPVGATPDPLARIAKRHQLTPTARAVTYDRVETHPLIIRAADILSDQLRPWAEGVYITSLSRSPEDQFRLMRERRTRRWATQRSKHLAGLAVDVGFVGRRTSTWKLRDKAQAILEQELGLEAASLLRVVRERHCIHVEIDTYKGRDIIVERARHLENLGIVEEHPEARHPVPELSHYVPEGIWTATRAYLEPLPL